MSALEKRTTAPTVNGTAPTAPQKAPPAPAKQEEEDEDEDEIDLFGSDEEVDEEAERLKEQRLQEYAAKKAKKPALIAKSSILLDVKPVSVCSREYTLCFLFRFVFVALSFPPNKQTTILNTLVTA